MTRPWRKSGGTLLVAAVVSGCIHGPSGPRLETPPTSDAAARDPNARSVSVRNATPGAASAGGATDASGAAVSGDAAASAAGTTRATATGGGGNAPGGAGGPLAAEDDVICDRVLDDFSAGPEGSFPVGWETHPSSALDRTKKEGSYRVVRHEGRRVLHARSGGDEVSIGLGVEGWDLERHPIVEWEWKAVRLPSGADESQGGRQDTAAAVTAVWMIGLPFVVRRLGYSYSSALPVGSRVSSRFGYDRLLVVDSGAEHVGQWRRVRVDLREHYRRFFDRTDAEAPTGIALTTDADDTGSRAEAYYANLRLCRPRGDAASADSGVFAAEMGMERERGKRP